MEIHGNTYSVSICLHPMNKQTAVHYLLHIYIVTLILDRSLSISSIRIINDEVFMFNDFYWSSTYKI